jgi:hypothetical protein
MEEALGLALSITNKQRKIMVKKKEEANLHISEVPVTVSDHLIWQRDFYLFLFFW